MWCQLLILAQSKCNCPMWSFFNVILSINEWHLIQEHCSNYACSMPSCQTFGQIPARSPFSVTRFRIKGKLWTELVAEASSGGPQSIPATNPPYPNSRSSSPLSPPYNGVDSLLCPPEMLADGAECHLGHLEVVLLELLPRPTFSSVTTKAASTCFLPPPLQLDTHCRCPPRGLTTAATIGTQHLTATTAISRLDNESAEHGPVGLTVTHLPGTYLNTHTHTHPQGTDPERCLGLSKSDWYLHNQLVISWQPSVQQHNNKVGDWMSTRVSGCQVCAYGHPLYLNKVFVWSTPWRYADLQAEDVSPHSLHHLTHQTPLEKVYLSCLHNLIVCSSDSVVTSSYVPIFSSQL